MTILNDVKIKGLISQPEPIITPTPNDIQIQPASVDLRLDNRYFSFERNNLGYIDTRQKQHYGKEHLFTDDCPLVLHPHDFILCQTLETVSIPNNLLARVEGRSSFGRLGVAVHVTAGFIDPGFRGNITLEICNLGSVPVILYPEQRICQIVFEELCDDVEQPYGSSQRNKYQNQNRPTSSRINEDM